MWNLLQSELKSQEKLDEMSIAFSRSYAFYMGLFKDIQFYKVSS